MKRRLFLQSSAAAAAVISISSAQALAAALATLEKVSGAIGRVPVDATAFAHRYSMANMFAVVSWPMEESRDSHVKAIKDYWAKLAPFTHGWYTNDVDDHSSNRIHRNYQGNYERLARIKNRYGTAICLAPSCCLFCSHWVVAEA